MPELDDDTLRALVGDEPFTESRSHAEPAVVERKMKALDAEHVAPFHDWREHVVSALTRAGVSDPERHLPHVDPASAGVHARVVVLADSPSVGALEHAGGSGLVSPDNTDAAAERMWRLCGEAGLARSETVHWNVVVWDKALKQDRALVRAFLRRWLQVLEDPQRVILLGTAAKGFRADVRAGLPEAEITDVLFSASKAALVDPKIDEAIVAALRGY